MTKFYIKKVLLTGFFCTISYFASAQNDFVVTMENDTIRGQAITGLFGGAVKKFIPVSGGKIKVKPDKIKEYYISSSQKNMVAKITPGTTREIFLERLEKGSIELYELNRTHYHYSAYGGGTTSRQVNWYVSKAGAPIVLLKHNSWLTFSKDRRKNEFFDLIKDNQELADRFTTSDKFSFKEIKSLISLYNEDARRKPQR